MPEAENTLDALVENKMEQYVIQTSTQSIAGAESHPVNSTGFTHSSGQAVVEFTLVFLLFLVIAWIPADFGLAFLRDNWRRTLRVKLRALQRQIQI